MHIKNLGKSKICNTEVFIGENNQKYYYIYTVTLENGEYYKGYHSTNKIFDDYVGSSTHLEKRIKEDNIQILNFEIIKFAKNLSEIAQLEKEHIGDEWKDEYPLCLNEMPGGLIGGWQVIPKEILDKMRRKTFEDYRKNNPERAKAGSVLGGQLGSAVAHANKTEEGKSLMIAEHNKRQKGKIKVRKDWDIVNENDRKLFPRIYKRTEGEYEFGSGMCDEELYENVLKFDGWYRPEWKTKGKSIHSEETKNKIGKSCSVALKGRKFTEEHKKNLSISRKNNN